MIWPKERMTRFEVARLIGARSLQIALGAPVLVKSDDVFDPIKLSRAEFKEKVIPMTVKRKTPNGEETVVDVKVVIENWLNTHAGEI